MQIVVFDDNNGFNTNIVPAYCVFYAGYGKGGINLQFV